VTVVAKGRGLCGVPDLHTTTTSRLMLWDQQVPRTRKIKYTHSIRKGGSRELYVRLSGIMVEETMSSKLPL
jgi:hypothetical protein